MQVRISVWNDATNPVLKDANVVQVLKMFQEGVSGARYQWERTTKAYPKQFEHWN